MVVYLSLAVLKFVMFDKSEIIFMIIFEGFCDQSLNAHTGDPIIKFDS